MRPSSGGRASLDSMTYSSEGSPIALTQVGHRRESGRGAGFKTAAAEEVPGKVLAWLNEGGSSSDEEDDRLVKGSIGVSHGAAVSPRQQHQPIDATSGRRAAPPGEAGAGKRAVVGRHDEDAIEACRLEPLSLELLVPSCADTVESAQGLPGRSATQLMPPSPALDYASLVVLSPQSSGDEAENNSDAPPHAHVASASQEEVGVGARLEHTTAAALAAAAAVSAAAVRVAGGPQRSPVDGGGAIAVRPSEPSAVEMEKWLMCDDDSEEEDFPDAVIGELDREGGIAARPPPPPPPENTAR